MSVDFSQLEKNLIKFSEAVNDKRVNQRLAIKCRDIIYKRVKDGYGVTSDRSPAGNTERQKLKKLSDSYIDYRKGVTLFFVGKQGQTYPVKKTTKRGKAIKFPSPVTGEFGRPTKSNLTLSGQMLKAIAFDYGDTGFRLFIDNSSRKDSKLTNKKVAEYASEDRPFFALTAGEVRILQRELENIINEIIKRIF